jgi:Cu(I)/Ag(I) efflux system membrane fusion protein
MNHEPAQDELTEMDMSVNNDSVSSAAVSSATVNGTVGSAMVDHRMVTIDREAIEEWGRAADRVDFIVEDNVDIDLFSTDAYVMFTFEVREGNFIIVSAMAMSKPDSALSAQKDVANDEGE